MKLFSALGLDVKILLAQLVNFAILVFVLYRFGYKPMFKFLEDRKNKIESGIKNSEEATKKLKKAEQEFNEMIVEAKEKATEIIKKADEQAERRKKDIIAKAKEEVGVIINQGKATIQLEKEKVLKEVKKDVAELVIMSTEKLLEQKLDAKKDSALIEKIIKK